MITQTLRQLQPKNLVLRTIHPIIPSRVEYKLTKLFLSLSASFCGSVIGAPRDFKPPFAFTHLGNLPSGLAFFEQKF